tara:strand:+ start:2296 stop:2673 length:378 start_codon:yes stop_codon:yes gene_type:complete
MDNNQMLIISALHALEIKNWYLKGTPANEAEFKEKFSKKDGSKLDVTWSQIQTALADGGVVAIAELRKQRTALLAETDWMASSDYNMTDAWKKYRQALRDLPANNKNVSWNGTTLSNVTFPTKPS